MGWFEINPMLWSDEIKNTVLLKSSAVPTSNDIH